IVRVGNQEGCARTFEIVLEIKDEAEQKSYCAIGRLDRLCRFQRLLRFVELIRVDREFGAQDQCRDHLGVCEQSLLDRSARAFEIAAIERRIGPLIYLKRRLRQEKAPYRDHLDLILSRNRNWKVPESVVTPPSSARLISKLSKLVVAVKVLISPR